MNASIITTRENTDFEQYWEDTLSLVLGFEEFTQGDEAQQKIIEAAYQAGVARGRYLGSLIRGIVARTPVDKPRGCRFPSLPSLSFTQRLARDTVPIFIQASYTTPGEIVTRLFARDHLTAFRFAATGKTSISRLWFRSVAASLTDARSGIGHRMLGMSPPVLGVPLSQRGIILKDDHVFRILFFSRLGEVE
jgi:hypothetical protein